jgi:hypothetical protein
MSWAIDQQRPLVGSSFAQKGFAANSFSIRRHWG